MKRPPTIPLVDLVLAYAYMLRERKRRKEERKAQNARTNATPQHPNAGEDHEHEAD